MSEILPLAFTMMIGPQIITAIILVTSINVVPASLGYVSGVAFATLTGTTAFFFIANLFNLSESDSDQPSQLALRIQTVLIVLLIVLAMRTFVNRKNAELPGWMLDLQDATPRSSFKIALTLIYLMPSDILIMSTVGVNLASHSEGEEYVHLLPFVALTALIAALPLLTYLLFREKAVETMPKVRVWMDSNSWVVSMIAYGIFLYLLWP